MGRKTVSEELRELGPIIKKLLLTPFPECLNDDHKLKLQKALDRRQELYKLKAKEEHENRGICSQTDEI